MSVERKGGWGEEGWRRSEGKEKKVNLMHTKILGACNMVY